ncbi:hypothetical protein [Arsukibacterium indicum]|uniref:Uncharacterized protein n=1 Tax=Arsukibacterium indicum TaxID=2848612 RepID=A0ABS6MLN9_9GAMM|nr:hypothetical protein [Arsukibacterium indicum]MBV2129274.1 hypothetical protein [Arsukibacterium indicum]
MRCTIQISASLLAGACLLTGCKITPAEPQPALLTNMSPAVKVELQQAIVELIGGQPVKLADNAFATRHQLFIEQAILRDEKGLPIMGRHSQPAILLELQQADNQCRLSHPASGNSVALVNSQCQPAATPEQ